MRSALAVAAAALAVLGTAAPLAAGASAPTAVPVVRVPGGTDWGYPQPFSYVRGPGLVNVDWIFDPLLYKDSTGKVIPWLAQSWRRSPDGLQYVFRLNRKATWQDGQPVTSADVAFTYAYMTTGPGSKVPGIIGSLNMIKAIATPDPRTVVFRLTQRFAPFPITIAGRVPIIPQHIWQNVTDPARFRGPQAVIGSGPYVLASYDAASGAYEFDANPNFYLGAPVVKKLQYVPESDDLLALQQGVIDAGGPANESGVSASVLQQFTGNTQRYGKLAAPGEWTRALYFNMTKGFPFDNRSFRQAVAYAIDRQDLVSRVLLGQGQVGSLGVIAPGSEWAAKGLPTYAYGPGKARQLLQSIGLVDRNGDGKRDLPDGSSFQPVLNTSTFQQQSTAEIVTDELRAVGIDVQLKVLDRNSADAATASGNYQMALIGYGGLGGDPDFIRQAFVPGAGFGFTRVFGYANDRFTQLANAQLVTVRTSTRHRFVSEMQQILARDVPEIPLYYPLRIWIYRKDVFGSWYYTPGGVWGGYPGTFNKQAFVTGRKVGS